MTNLEMSTFEMIYILRKPIITLVLAFVVSYIAVEVHERYEELNKRKQKRC